MIYLGDGIELIILDFLLEIILDDHELSSENQNFNNNLSQQTVDYKLVVKSSQTMQSHYDTNPTI